MAGIFLLMLINSFLVLTKKYNKAEMLLLFNLVIASAMLAHHVTSHLNIDL